MQLGFLSSKSGSAVYSILLSGSVHLGAALPSRGARVGYLCYRSSPASREIKEMTDWPGEMSCCFICAASKCQHIAKLFRPNTNVNRRYTMCTLRLLAFHWILSDLFEYLFLRSDLVDI
jgi:hypothetical protein